MRIAILSRDKSLYSCSRLQSEAIKRKHQVTIIDPLFCLQSIQTQGVQLFYQQNPLIEVDAVIPRIGILYSLYGLTLLRQLELNRCFVINPYTSIINSRNKYFALQLLQQAGIAIPATTFAFSVEHKDRLIKEVGGAPLIIKILEGAQGAGIILADTWQAAASMIDALSILNTPFLLQEYIREANGKDVRCFVIGEKVVAAIERKAQVGDFRSNLHRGGEGRNVVITTQEYAMAVQATKALGLNVAGVDILRSKKGPLVIEVNSSPGLEGIEKATQKNIARKIIQFIEEKVSASR